MHRSQVGGEAKDPHRAERIHEKGTAETRRADGGSKGDPGTGLGKDSSCGYQKSKPKPEVGTSTEPRRGFGRQLRAEETGKQFGLNTVGRHGGN